jgi:two-component system nitrate/nitrite response regulator NarL
MVDKITLLLVDDHALFRKGLASLLSEQEDFRIIGEAVNANEGIQLSRMYEPDVVLLDVNMPGGGGLEAVKTLKQELDVRILMLTVSDKDQDLLGALGAGADGYMLKNAEPHELCQAIRQVAAGHGALSPEVTKQVMQAASTRERQPSTNLSRREVEILEYLARGATTTEIARSLVISDNTVKTHVRNILKKMDAANRAEAVARAAAQGLLPE